MAARDPAAVSGRVIGGAGLDDLAGMDEPPSQSRTAPRRKLRGRDPRRAAVPSAGFTSALGGGWCSQRGGWNWIRVRSSERLRGTRSHELRPNGRTAAHGPGEQRPPAGRCEGC
ncbi:unnamed protein product [Urochloa humidicola]